MPQQIRTKWHQVQEMINEDEVYVSAPIDGKAEHWDKMKPDKNMMKFLAQQYAELPRFVISDELMELAQGENFHQSLLDMKKAGVLRLPYPAIMVEFRTPGGRRALVMLRDIGQMDNTSTAWEESGSKWKANLPEDHERGVKFDDGFYGVNFFLDNDKDGDYLVTTPGILFIDIREGAEGQPMMVMGSDTSNMFANKKEASDLIGQTYVKDGSWVWRALCASMLLMHTDGVAKEVIDCSKINRKRANDKKPLIPRHIYLHIGRVYRSADSDVSDEYIPRKSPRPHWRRGHLKTFWHGPQKTLKKQRYIHPKIVALKSPIDDEPKMNKEYHVMK
jgi:hypothetical protein